MNVLCANGDMIRWQEYTLKPTTNRGAEWCVFAKKVLSHIENYTIPQYSDKPDDQAEGWSAGDCAKQCARYGNRFETNIREGQEHLDPLKVAHYACLWESKIDDETPLIPTSLEVELSDLVNGVLHGEIGVDDFIKLFKKYKKE